MSYEDNIRGLTTWSNPFFPPEFGRAYTLSDLAQMRQNLYTSPGATPVSAHLDFGNILNTVSAVVPRTQRYSAKDNDGGVRHYMLHRDGDYLVTSLGPRIHAPKPGNGVAANIARDLRETRDRHDSRAAEHDRQAAHCRRMSATYNAAAAFYASEAADAAREERAKEIDKLAGDLMGKYHEAVPYGVTGVKGFKNVAEHVQKLIDDAVKAATAEAEK